MIASKIKASDLAVTFNVSHYQNGNNISCHGANNGMIEAVIVGGVSPYNYSWSTGSYSKVITGLGAAVYTFTVTDASGNTVSNSFELIQPELLEVNLTAELFGGYNISEQGGSNGRIVAEVKGGSTPYYYSWSNGTTKESCDNLSAGSYNVTVTDVNGCSISGSKTLTEPTPLHVVSITSPLHRGYNVSCYSGSDGQIDLTVTGGVPPYKYDWSNGSFNEVVAGLSSGEYSVRISDANEIEITASIQLTQPTKLELVLTPQVYSNGFNLSCHDCANGSLTALCTNGVSPYTYLWSNSQSTPTISGLQARDYKCQVTDANGCIISTAKSLTAPDRDDWSMTGNINTDPATQFMGTTDNKDFVFKTNNVERMRIAGTGSIKVPSFSGTTQRRLIVNPDGSIGVGDEIRPIVPCSNLTVTTDAWFGTNVTGQYGGTNVVNCNQQFGFGVMTPTERIHAKGFAAFSSASNLSDYLKIGNDGNSRISSFGSGDLLINENSSQNVNLCTGSTAGFVKTGSNTYLATNSGNVGINTTTPREKLEVLGSIMLTGGTVGNGSNFLKLWNDNVNSFVGNYGSGGLFINYYNSSDVELCTGNLRGRVITGSDTYLATLSGNVGIGTSIAYETLQLGDKFTFHSDPIGNGGNCIIGRNCKSTGVTSNRLLSETASRINLNNNGDILFQTAPSGLNGTQIGWVDGLFISNDGAVGIHTATPTTGFNLDVSGPALINGFLEVNHKLYVQGPDISLGKYDMRPQGVNTQNRALVHGFEDDLIINYNNDFEGGVVVNSNGTGKAFRIINNSSGITDFQVMGEGIVYARELNLMTDNFPDFVFDKNYNLLTLDSLSSYIDQQKHLPNIPSASEVKSNDGNYSIGELQLQMLAKIEELTLYILQLKKENEQIKHEINEVKKM